MATSRLQLYNSALRLCGERKLASLTEDREPRHLLDDVWADDGRRTCLEAGLWRFAMRAQKLFYEPSVEPPFGYRRAFLKPEDWVRTAAVCQDEYYRVPLLSYVDEFEYIYADLDEIYVRFVSDHANFGADLATWPGSFSNYAAAYFASQIIPKLTGDKGRIDRILAPRTGLLAVNLRTARANDAMKDPTKFFPVSSWVRSRSSRTRGRGPMGDGGTSGSLTG